MMTGQPIRVMLVDDSALIRQIVTDQLSEQPDLLIVGRARDGEDALAQVDRLQPDVIVLDVEMPRLNGLETLRRLLPERPIPVVMFSSLTQAGAKTTLDAIDLGAMECVGKPTTLSNVASVCGELANKIRAVAGCNVAAAIKRRKFVARASRTVIGEGTAPSKRTALCIPHSTPGVTDAFCRDKVIAVGISTGGPPALAAIFQALAVPSPPIVIVQHMPPGFTRSFAERLDRLGKIAVKEAATGDRLVPNTAFVAPGGRHVRVVGRRPGDATLEVFDAEPVSSHRPSVDVMMNSVAEVYGSNAVGVIMTGMGRDGVAGCGAIKQAGGITIGQDEESSDVYGMNKIAWRDGMLDSQFSLETAPCAWFEALRRLGHVQPV